MKDKWIAGLKSGEYTQGRYFLKKEGKYCCLGVLCDVLRGELPGVKFEDYEKCLFVDGINTSLPISVRRKVGLTSQGMNKLIEMNDELESSFEDIALELEMNGEKYFH